MLKTYRKNRAPFLQLKEASEVSRALQLKKKMVGEKSIFERMATDPHAPILPGGMNPYLPDEFTLRVARQMVMTIVKKWVQVNKGNNELQEKIEPFYRFAVRKMEDEERKFIAKGYNDRIESLANQSADWTIAKVFSNHRSRESAESMKRYIADSFNISLYNEGHRSVSEYLEWYDEWTDKLYAIWKNKITEKNSREQEASSGKS